jgi:glycosyltransferase involved in cell wall biosynthesis
MKVLLANKFFHTKGGSERVLFQERQFLLDHGHVVVDFSMQDSMNYPSPYAGSFVRHIDYQNAPGILNKAKQAVKFIHSPEAIKKLKRLIDKERPDIAHLHNIYHQITPSIIPLLKRHGIPVVLTLHDSKLICPSYLMLNKGRICQECAGCNFWRPLAMHCQNSRIQELLFMLEAYWHLWRASYDGVDLFLSPSRFMADLVSQRIPKEKIRVLPNGIDTTTFTPAWDDLGYVIYVGRVTAEKGIETLLKAHDLSGRAFSLKIVGTGPDFDNLRRSYPHAEFIGYREGDELYKFIRNAACVVVPSECLENCSMVILEAMVMGKPVIGSRTGGIPEQIEDGKTGLLFEIGNASELAEKLDHLMKNPMLRVVFGKAARQKCEREYALQKHNHELLEIYMHLLNRRARSNP